MTVGIVGSGPAATAVEAALADVDATTRRIDAAGADAVEAAIVVDQAGAGAFERANEATRSGGTPWLAVELGGVGGFPVVDAAVTTFETACYECLSGRVGANLSPETDPVAAPPARTARFAGAVAGRRLADFLAGDTLGDGVTEVDGATVTRDLLPLPDCVCAGAPDRDLDRDANSRELEAALSSAERAVDRRVGIVTEVGEAASFPVPYYLAQTCDTTGFSDVAADDQAAGVDADWDAAFMKALGEGLERYCAGVYRRAEFKRGLPADVNDAVPPTAFVCPGDQEVTAPVDWLPGEALVSGNPARLPADFVLHPPPGERFRPAVTTGLGLGNSTVGALLAGLYEIIERDAAMLSWYSTFDPLELSIEDGTVGTLRRRARSENLETTLLVVTQDVDVPVVAAAVQREAWPRFALGSAAHLDPAVAARSALAEALQNWTELEGMGPDAAADAGGAIGRYADLPAAAEEFVDADKSVPADSLDAGMVPEGAAHLEAVLDRVADTGLEPYGVRLTTRDVEQLGFEAVRVLIPAAQPLFLGDSYFGERAESVPADLGFEPRFDREPHPFP